MAKKFWKRIDQDTGKLVHMLGVIFWKKKKDRLRNFQFSQNDWNHEA